MQFTAQVQRTVDNQIEQWKNTVLASVMLMSQQDPQFKQTLLAALQGDNIAADDDIVKTEVDVEEH